MTTYLVLNCQLRTETDEQVVENLLRKGWQLAPPKPDQNATWENCQWVPPPPPPPLQWENTQSFMAAFTMQEKAAIALSTDPTIAALRLELTTWLSSVPANSPAVLTGLDKLVDLQILTPQRKTEILATAT